MPSQSQSVDFFCDPKKIWSLLVLIKYRIHLKRIDFLQTFRVLHKFQWHFQLFIISLVRSSFNTTKGSSQSVRKLNVPTIAKFIHFSQSFFIVPILCKITQKWSFNKIVFLASVKGHLNTYTQKYDSENKVEKNTDIYFLASINCVNLEMKEVMKRKKEIFHIH